MALPTNLAAKLKFIPMDPTVLATNLELAYLLSFATHNVSHDSIYLYPRESYQSPLEHYQFADFDDHTYNQLLQQTLKNYKLKNKQVAKGIRCGFKEFYARVAANTYTTSIKFMSREKIQSEKKLSLPKEEEEQYRIEKLKGNNPTKWPESTKEFLKDINNLPWHAFSYDSEIMFTEFAESAKQAIINLSQKAKVVEGRLQDIFKQNITLEIQALLGVVLRTNCQSFILQQLKFISELKRQIPLDTATQTQLCRRISNIFDNFFSSVPQEQTQKYHSPGSLWNRDPFAIMKKIHFQKYAGLAYYTIATDGQFLYFYISAVNGGMFKIGTGHGGTKAGKIYLEKSIFFPIGTKVDEVNWVFLKSKLYLKTSSKDPWILEVINPSNFTKQGNIQLFCPALFGQQSLINLNKSCPLMTDGQSLYYLGNRIKICKSQQPEDHPEPKQSKSQEKLSQDKKLNDQKKKAPKRKAGKKSQPNENPTEQQKSQNYQKILQIVLYQFSINGNRTYDYEGIDEKDIEELYDSFSGYFTTDQCRRALILNNYDLAETCQWLFNEGQKQKDKNIKIFDEVDCVILAQCEITSNFQQKSIKGPSEITTKDPSTLSISNIYESIWTMDRQHISCYSENGLKIFSKNKKDFNKNPQTKLSSTLLKVLQSKYPRNPECNVIYDPYNYVFYTFAWPQDGHYFPTAILMSNDKKHSMKIQQEKKMNGDIQKLVKLSDIQKYALQHMSYLDRTSLKTKYRFNDWLWYYGQRIIEIGNQMSLADSNKTKLSNKRAKFLGKINNINQTQRIYQKDKVTFGFSNKVIKEIIKIYPFQAEGTLKSYYMITDAFKDLPEHPQQIYLYVHCLQNWLCNCSTIAGSQIHNVLLQLGQNLLILKQKSTCKNRDLINKLLLQQFYLFFPSLEKQIKYICLLNHEELSNFVTSQWKHEKKQKESIVYQITKKQHIIQKFQTNKCDFTEIFKSQSTMNVGQVDKVELLGNLLLSDILIFEKQAIVVKDKYNESSRKAFFAYVQKQLAESQSGNQLVQFLFLASLKMLASNSKNSQLFYKYHTELFIEVFKLYEKVIPKLKTSQLYSILPTLLMIIEVYHGSLVFLYPNQEIISNLLKILEYLQRPELNEIHSILDDYEYEGISPVTEKIYQTSHPLERGKNYNFPPRKFHNASILLLDLDKRCQSDPNNDTLTIQIVHEDSPVGNNIQINDGVFSSNIRLSGVVETKKPHLLFGKAVTVDFNSSGHVKDTQSLVRYGFKLGLRPVFTGRIKLNDSKKDRIVKLFQNIQNFQYYFNTIKFITVAISNSIENYLHLQSEISDPKIDELLKGKIFKEGFEQSAFKLDYKIIDPIQTINKFITKVDYESVDKLILKKSQQQFWAVKKVQPMKAGPAEEQLWNFNGIPSYIKTYLNQIKDFKGNFIDVFTEARLLVKEKGTYAQIMKRKVVQEQKTLWLQGEAILFLTILKHSGLLHLNLKFSIQYIKQNLKAFEDARDGIYNSFISRIQYVNEWRHLIQTYIGKEDEVEFEKKEEPQPEEKKAPQIKAIAVKKKGGPSKTVKIGEKMEQKKQMLKKQKSEQKPQKKMDRTQFEKEVRQRLANQQLIKGICNTRNIKYDEHNKFDTATKIIDQLIKGSELPLLSEEKAYKDPIEHLIKCCLFLMKFKSPSTKQSLSENEHIVPIGMLRSFSQDSRNCDTNKVNIFREWLENFKNWKGFKKEGHFELQFPVEQIVKYINSWVDLKDLNMVINKRYLKCDNRLQFYSNSNQLLKLISQTKIIKYTLGSETLNLSNLHSSDLQSVTGAKLKQLQEIYSEFKKSIKSIEGMLINQLPLTLSKLDEALKGGSNKFLDKVKLLLQSIFLLESQNPQIDLNVVLYIISLKFLSTQNEDLIYLSNALLQRGFISKHSNQEIISCLNREVGSNNISYKRWKDYFFVERVLFLMRKLESNLRTKNKLERDIQTKIAETIFYILYHIEIPLVAKLGLKILKILKNHPYDLPLKKDMKTPFDYEYKIFKSNLKNELEYKQTFRLPRNTKNNVTLLCSKISDIFNSSNANQLALKFQQVKEPTDTIDRYNIIINLHQEEDLYWMLKVLYYIDELQVKNGEKVFLEIKDFQQYLHLKNRKREGQKRDQQSQNPPNENEKQKNPFKEQEKNQRIFNTLPKFTKVDSELEKELPVGWFFNYCNIFASPLQKVSSLHTKPVKNVGNAMQAALKNPKGNKNPNNNNNPNNPNTAAKKSWNTPLFTKIAKKYEQFNSKPPEEPKQGDSTQLKMDYVKARNIYNRIRRYLVEVSIMMDHFSRNGYYVMRQDISRTKMNQICQLITSGSINRLKDVNIDLKNNDIKTRLIFNDFTPNFSSKLKISIIKNKDYPYFQSLVTYQSGVFAKTDHTHNSYYALLGKRELSLQDSKAFMPYELFIPFDQPAQEEDEQDIQFGKQWIESNFSRMKKRYEKVYLNDYPNDTFYLAQGGIESGVRENTLVPANDSLLTLQTVWFEKIMTEPQLKPQQEYQETQNPQDLVKKINKIIDKGRIQISKRQDIKDYLLLTFYLKKLKTHDLQFDNSRQNKQFAKKLFKFTEHLNSFKELSAYKEDIQKLIIKLIDNEHEKLHLFGTYIHDEDYDEDISEYLIPVKLEKLNSSNEVKQESIKTHAYIKSKYLLKSQPPQIEQNKLLKYWEKIILPKILQFVKTTLKPLEIEDFWQQMRRPLRVGDHTEAKRVAYIICDNKLPAGAILPDASHNWNSLEIEQISVGENVLVKIPKAKGDFCTPLLAWDNNDQKLAKIVFIDLKSNSVLIRYRLQELALFSYTWVPINALMAAQKEVMHISTKSIYEELSKKLEGIIYIYAKQCLTKLASAVSEGDNIKLIRQTILDLFVKNPISGCFDFPKPVWSMRPVFEKMLQQKNYAILDILYQSFCSIKGIDLNINSQKMTELNRFEDAKAIIVSFKKDAKLSVCSGVRFYNDKFGYNEIAHIYSAKNDKSDIQPLEFNQPNIYCRYYSNKQCLPIVEQSNYKIYPIQATIFAVDDMWIIGCYIGETVCQIASSKNSSNYIEILQRLNTIYLRWLTKKSVSILCSYLAKLISKISLTIGSICEKNGQEITFQSLGTSIDQIKDFINWIINIMTEESNQKAVLYSALLQDLSEMVGSILVKVNHSIPNIPQHIKSSIDLIKMFKQIDLMSKTKKISLLPPSPPANYQWQRILEISNIPSYFSPQTIFNKMKEIIKINKGKILCPKLDIYQKNGSCYILVDGWDINELIEEEVMQKMEQEIQEQRQEEMNANTGTMDWECQACTFKNPLDVNICQMCQSPAPVAAKQEEVYDQVEATDLKAAERKLKVRQAKRFQQVKVQILKFFEDEYKGVCDLVQKRNQQLQQNAKNKDFKKSKKGKQETNDLKQIPKKPEINLETGSRVFQKQQINEFLKARFEYFSGDLKKLVSEQKTYILKFKKLLNLGYDLWGDNITNQNATLIPFTHLYLLMDLIQTEICKGSSSMLSYSEDSIRIFSQIHLLDFQFGDQPINYTTESDVGVRAKYKSLTQFKSYNIRYSWKFVKELNLAASKCLQFINMDFKYDRDRNDTCPTYSDSLGYKIKYYRNLIMGVIKLELFQKIMQKTSISRENDEIPKILLERLRVREERAKSGLITAKQKEDHLFTKSHDQFLKVSPAFLRPFKPKGADPYLSFTVTFKGENVMGQAGPYRQFFTDIGRQLDPHYCLGLFIPSPNNRHQSGDHKSKWVINPKANSTYHFSLFQYIGTLMGCCFRTGSHLALDLPTMFWKSITNQQIKDQDLEEVDLQLISLIKTLEEQFPTKQQFEEGMEYHGGQLTWVYSTCDDEEHQMIYNGKNIKVQFEDLGKYIQMLKLKRINQSKRQIKRIVQGISQLIPLPYLHCLTGQELKLIICGRPKVDVELLKKHTKYSGGLNEQSRRIKFFWEIMRELPETERLKIIRFCWGQERLPINSEQFERNNIRFMIKPMVANAKNQDQALPKADTCFFNIELPDYSTKTLMKEKILLAVNLDNVSINADENIYNDDNPLMNEINTLSQEDYNQGEEEW